MMRDHGRHLALGLVLSLGAIGTTLIAPAATFAADTATTTATTATTCDEGRWPASAQGRPLTFRAGARAGDYLWHDGSGWHLRFTHPGAVRVVFSGTLVANAPLTVASYRFEAGDRFSLSADRLTLTYRVVNHGRIDGLDIRTACATRLRVKGSMAGAKLPTWRIWVGRAGRHPLQNPFAILRNR